jgi:hypothetical protein
VRNDGPTGVEECQKTVRWPLWATHANRLSARRYDTQATGSQERGQYESKATVV